MRQKRFSAQLPATPCEPEMRSQFERIAKERQLNLADVQREAFNFYLLKKFSFTKQNIVKVYKPKGKG